MRQSEGFTLVELMITLIILITLVLLVIPSYQAHVVRSRRLEGQMCLFNKECHVSLNGFYQIETVYHAAAAEHTRKAIPVGIQASDRCGVLTLSSTYLKGAAQLDCWE